MSQTLTRYEKKVAAVLAGIFSLRMMGLFMIMPVMAVYSDQLTGISPLWIGIIIGAYGLTQALLQIPMGLLSDKIGRRPVIILGLSLFAIGSLIAAMADHVYWVAFGRFIQGTGAIASAVLALASDLTLEQQRSKVMAIIGMSIGLSFAAAMVVGPLLAERFGLSGIFLLTAIFAVLGIVLVYFQVPNSVSSGSNRDAIPVPAQLKKLAKHPQLIKLNLGVYILHMLLTCLFVAIPGLLVDAGFAANSHWMMYFPALLASFVFMAPMSIWAVKRNKELTVFKLAIVLLAVAMLVIYFSQHELIGLFIALIVFFVAFNYLEANLPAWVSRIAPAGQKGSAMGMYSSCQFAGAFSGGMIGGLVLQLSSVDGLLMFCAFICLPWLWLANNLVLPVRTKPKVVSVAVDSHQIAEDMAQALIQIKGIEEAVVIVEEQLAYLKVLPKQLDENALEAYLNQQAK